MGKKHYKYPCDLNDCQFLGRGNNGEVYLLPDGNVIKICFKKKHFKDEYQILQRVNGNHHFPRIFAVGKDYMVRECVHGEILSKYLKKHGMNRELAHNLIEMLKEFQTLQFAKIDLRCKDVFVQPDGSLKMIDPKHFYSKKRDFPRHLAKGLYKLKSLDVFLAILHQEEPELFQKWYPQIYAYIRHIYWPQYGTNDSR